MYGYTIVILEYYPKGSNSELPCSAVAHSHQLKTSTENPVHFLHIMASMIRGRNSYALAYRSIPDDWVDNPDSILARDVELQAVVKKCMAESTNQPLWEYGVARM